MTLKERQWVWGTKDSIPEREREREIERERDIDIDIYNGNIQKITN